MLGSARPGTLRRVRQASEGAAETTDANGHPLSPSRAVSPHVEQPALARSGPRPVRHWPSSGAVTCRANRHAVGAGRAQRVADAQRHSQKAPWPVHFPTQPSRVNPSPATLPRVAQPRTFPGARREPSDIQCPRRERVSGARSGCDPMSLALTVISMWHPDSSAGYRKAMRPHIGGPPGGTSDYHPFVA